jgi:transcriptional regulator with XRE-family HTH domain
VSEYTGTLSPEEANRFLRARLRELRRGARMSQAFLAERMTERGFHWHQTTVHRIESGRQEATFKEVAALAEIFAIPLRSFISPEEEAS